MEQKKKILRPTTNLQYENILSLLDEVLKRRFEVNADFILPLNFRFSDLGNSVAFCQIIITWFKLNPKSKLRIYDNNFSDIESELQQAIDQICEEASLPTLLAIIFGSRTGIWGYTRKDADYTSKFLPALERRLIYDYQELSKVGGNQTLYSEYFQIHPDFLKQSLFLKNASFYLKIGTKYVMKPEFAINEVTTKLFNRIDSLGTELTKNWLKETQTYFYELFENAYKWARNDWTKVDEPELENTLRLFFLSSKNYQKDRPVSNVNIDQRLNEFAKRNTAKDLWGSNTKMMELSILDNGIGIVQTFRRMDILRSSMSIKEEYDSLLEAFKLGSTSDRSYRGLIRGIGLSKVISQSKNAFVIVRTGRLFLYRDFSLFPFSSSDDLYFFDASDEAKNIEDIGRKIKPYPFATGTLFSFIIPL
jgi:hypothetical protein